jgi:hypothetical protein
VSDGDRDGDGRDATRRDPGVDRELTDWSVILFIYVGGAEIAVVPPIMSV